jgi:hypothetical protein
MLARCNQDDPQLAGGSPRARHSNALSRAQVQSFLANSGHSAGRGLLNPADDSSPEFPAAVSPQVLGPDSKSFDPVFEAEHAFMPPRYAELAAAAEVRSRGTRCTGQADSNQRLVKPRRGTFNAPRAAKRFRPQGTRNICDSQTAYRAASELLLVAEVLRMVFYCLLPSCFEQAHSFPISIEGVIHYF